MVAARALRRYNGDMNLPMVVPDWLPWWVPTILLVVALLWLLLFLLVPFSVIGLKSRLEGLEARLDEIQAEIRTLTLRLPDQVQSVDFDELYAEPPRDAPRRAPAFERPPIPPAAHELEDETDSPDAPPPNSFPRPRRADPGRPARDVRTEPRLDWPR